MADDTFIKKTIHHLAIIMDGNRRWARERGLPTLLGHKEGVTAVERAIHACRARNINYLTVFAFSTENWNRTAEEVGYLMKLVEESIIKAEDFFQKNNIRLRILGDLQTKVDARLATGLQNVVTATADNTGLAFSICFNYGARNEIIQAIRLMLADGYTAQDITENTLVQYLYTKDLPDPDMIVRTSGEMRLSNFLLWQAAYSELLFLDCYWPDFDAGTLDMIIAEYQKRQRRYGT